MARVDSRRLYCLERYVFIGEESVLVVQFLCYIVSSMPQLQHIIQLVIKNSNTVLTAAVHVATRASLLVVAITAIFITAVYDVRAGLPIILSPAGS